MIETIFGLGCVLFIVTALVWIYFCIRLIINWEDESAFIGMLITCGIILIFAFGVAPILLQMMK